MLKATINGVEYRLLRDFYITEQVGNKTSSSFQIVVDDLLTQPVPVSGDIIELTDSETGDRLFFGQCGIPKSPKFQTGNELLVYTVICSNANAILSNRIINVAYKGWTVSAIVQDLFNRYIAEEGITLGQITRTDVTLVAYNAGNFNLQDALDELSSAIGACWQVSNDKKFYFIGQDDFPRFPSTINDHFLLGTDLESRTTNYKQRTVQYISGGFAETDTQTETFPYDGQTNTFTTSFPLVQQPSVSVNGIQVDPSKIGVAGLTDDLDSVVFRWAYNSNTVSYKDTSKYLSAGDTVSIAYVGQYPIRVKVSNTAKVQEIAAKTGTSGKREQVCYDSTVTSLAQAYELANQLLSQFEEATSEVKFWLLSSQLYDLGMTLSDTDLYTVMTFDLPRLGISGTYVVTERKIEPFQADLSDPERKFKVSLTLKNRDYLKSYGETISTIQKDVNGLNYRGDETVLNYEQVDETLTLLEEVTTDYAQLYFAVASVKSGSLFAPCGLGCAVYPMTTTITAGGTPT